MSDAAVQLGGKADSFVLPEKIAAVLPVEQRNKLAGRGYSKLGKSVQTPSIERGEVVYNQTCATCHGDNGQGYYGKSVNGKVLGEHAFPVKTVDE